MTGEHNTNLYRLLPSSFFILGMALWCRLCNEWEQKILNKYQRVAGFTSLESKLNYLDYVWNPQLLH